MEGGMHVEKVIRVGREMDERLSRSEMNMIILFCIA